MLHDPNLISTYVDEIGVKKQFLKNIILCNLENFWQNR